MAAKKAKGPQKTKAADAGKESDEDFLKRVMGMKDEASKKASEELGSYSQEIEEFRAKGKQVGKDLEEIEECKKIQKEFEASPPIAISTHIDGKPVDYHYEERFQKKIDLLKKHGFGFLCAAHSSNIIIIPFSVPHGRAYVKRGSRKILLPPSSADLPFALKDGDILCTEHDSDAQVTDIYNNETESFSVTLYPDSELRLSLSEKETHPEPAFMEPARVPEAIKKNSKSTLLTYRLKRVELLKGLFSITRSKQGEDVNGSIQIPSGYPRIRFESFGKLGAHMLETQIQKVAGQRPELKALLERQYRPRINESRSKVCDSIGGFIELNTDGTIVILTGGNSVVHLASGKATTKIGKMKITVTQGAIYETDCTKNPDPRVSAIMSSASLWGPTYSTAVKQKAYLEAKIAGRSPPPPELEKAKELVRYAEGLGDKDLLKIAKKNLADQEEDLKRQADAKANFPSALSPEGREAAKAEAMRGLKVAEDIGDEKLIEMAKINVKTAGVSHDLEMAKEMVESAKESGNAAKIKIAEDALAAVRSGKAPPDWFEKANLMIGMVDYDRFLKETEPKAEQAKLGMPPYNRPAESDRVA